MNNLDALGEIRLNKLSFEATRRSSRAEDELQRLEIAFCEDTDRDEDQDRDLQFDIIQARQYYQQLYHLSHQLERDLKLLYQYRTHLANIISSLDGDI